MTRARFEGAGAVRPPPGTVDLWLARPDDATPDRREAWLGLLSPEERLRHEGLISPDARLQHLIGRALVRTILGRYADVAPRALRFEANAYGRPRIAGPRGAPDLRFNLSHTGGLVALAVAEGFDVGVDVERVTGDLDVGQLADIALAATERAAVAAACAHERRRLFFTVWTLKEAYVKARGMSLAMPLTAIAFDLAGDEPRVAFDQALVADDPARWRFRSFTPTPEHALALAAATERLEVRVFEAADVF